MARLRRLPRKTSLCLLGWAHELAVVLHAACCKRERRGCRPDGARGYAKGGGPGFTGSAKLDPKAPEAQKFFRKRSLVIAGLAVGFAAINAVSGGYVGFDFAEAVVDIPSGLAWMAVNFLPQFGFAGKAAADFAGVTFHRARFGGFQHHGSCACLCGCRFRVAFGGAWRRGTGFGTRHRFAVPQYSCGGLGVYLAVLVPSK